MNVLQHSGLAGFGENLCFRSSNPVQCVQDWYDEVKDYDYRSPGFSGKTGHFTQLVWKNSKKLGIGMADGSSGTYVVARYTPPGNFEGGYTKNVLSKSSHLKLKHIVGFYCVMIQILSMLIKYCSIA